MRVRKRAKPHEQKHDRWLVSYADLVTVLFAFFVVMYSISSVNDDKYKTLLSSLEKSFSSPAKTQTNMAQTESTAQIESTTQTRSNPLPSKTEAELLLRTQTAKHIAQDLAPYIKKNLIEVTHYPRRIEVEMKSQLLFNSAQATLTPPALPVLKQLATLIRTLSNKIQVEGYTDNRPIHTPIFPSNWELSAARAASVVHQLMQHGIEPQRMAAIGYGQYHPIAENDTPQGRLKNRRVVLVLLL